MRLCLLLLAFTSSIAFATQIYPRVDEKLDRYDSELAQMNDAFSRMPSDVANKHWVTLKLTHMVYIDQYMRSYAKVPRTEGWTPEEIQYFWQEFFPRWQSLDSTNTSDLKTLLATHSWITISKFDESADEDAWLLVQHADFDLDFQKEVLSKLEELYPRGETSPKHFGYLYDRVAMHENRFQRYGTQGVCEGDSWRPQPDIEDFEHVDERRLSLGMISFAENKARLDRVCSEL